MKYERLYIDEIDDAVMLAKRAEDYRIEYNEIRPHEALAWNRSPGLSAQSPLGALRQVSTAAHGTAVTAAAVMPDVSVAKCA